ncbi:hypothetical protein LGR54_13330 [Ancylobacter sp. Lp-2]|uniref:hypothetical protein n=1 Tax=Ancylobacter sp. Lp-2 TaxID=2881339 RepID=UPI001E611462|nr:hypothetical protein [Ancylobacter sp. Lp-2]MCB4769595.1 hypothetical protein [Ancylobacter sp. Lp-2]
MKAPTHGLRMPRQRVIEPFATPSDRALPVPELKDRGYEGSYTAVTDFLREVRRAPAPGYDVRFETEPGEQAEVDLVQLHVAFAEEPTALRIVWLFSMVLGYSRLILARFVLHQELPMVLCGRCVTFDAIGSVPREILCDRMKAVATGERGRGHRVQLQSRRARCFGSHPAACRPYHSRAKSRVGRPFRYIRQGFFLAR